MNGSQGDITLKDVVTEPQEILALFASKKQQDKGKLEQNCFKALINIIK